MRILKIYILKSVIIKAKKSPSMLRNSLLKGIKVLITKSITYVRYFISTARIIVNEFIFLVIHLKAVYVTGQNDRPTEILSGQIVILTGHCPMTGRYFDPCPEARRRMRSRVRSKQNQTFLGKNSSWQEADNCLLISDKWLSF